MDFGAELDWIAFIAKEEQTRLDFIVKLNKKTGETIGPAWKIFGYRGPRYHDGYLYGKVDGNKELTGKLLGDPTFKVLKIYYFRSMYV